MEAEENDEDPNDDAMTISDSEEDNRQRGNENQTEQLQDKSNNQPLKRKHSSPSSDRPGSSKDKDDDDGQLCPICFDSWTSNGPHRLTSLRCGHLFGYSCLKRWLNTQQPCRCPTCNAKAKKTDIRHIYARKLIVVDNSEVVRLTATLEQEKECRRRAELDTASVRLLYQQVADDCQRLQQTVEELRRQQQSHSGQTNHHAASSSRQTQQNPDEINLFTLERKLNICEAGQARVFAWESRLGVIAIAVPSTNDLFPGFGIRKVSTVDWRPGQFVPLHSKAIRDLATKPSRFADGYLLSASMDGTVKVTSLSCNVPVVNYSAQTGSAAPLAAWSCAWHSTSSFHFYCGYNNGTVRLYDIRKNDQYIREIQPMGSHAPVVSLQHVNRTAASGNANLKGLVVGQLDRITFHEEVGADPADCNAHVLHMDGGLSSLYFEPITEHLLATYRPSPSATGSSSSSRVRHLVCSLEATHLAGIRSCSLSVKQTIYGGRTQRLLSRSRLLPIQSSLYLVAGDEESKAVGIWDIGTDKLKQRVDLSSSLALDMVHINGQQAADHGKFLTLDEGGKMSVFRLTPTPLST